jgi:PRTRC genetic system protein B
MVTNNVTVNEGRDDSLRLSAALLLYRSNSGSVYATSHDIVQTDTGARVLGPGMPAGKSALAKFADSVADATAYRGMVPANLLYTAADVIAWWSPSAVRRVWFKSVEKKIGTVSAEVRHPPLVFVATAKNWFVFALHSDERPTESTAMYKAPYFNVWAEGRICTGNVDLPKQIGPESIRAYEDAFFRSHFTHPNEASLVKYKGGATALWAEQIKHPEKRLLTPDVLISSKETFKQMINRVLKEQQR